VTWQFTPSAPGVYAVRVTHVQDGQVVVAEERFTVRARSPDVSVTGVEIDADAVAFDRVVTTEDGPRVDPTVPVTVTVTNAGDGLGRTVVRVAATDGDDRIVGAESEVVEVRPGESVDVPVEVTVAPGTTTIYVDGEPVGTVAVPDRPVETAGDCAVGGCSASLGGDDADVQGQVRPHARTVASPLGSDSLPLDAPPAHVRVVPVRSSPAATVGVGPFVVAGDDPLVGEFVVLPADADRREGVGYATPPADPDTRVERGYVVGTDAPVDGLVLGFPLSDPAVRVLGLEPQTLPLAPDALPGDPVAGGQTDGVTVFRCPEDGSACEAVPAALFRDPGGTVHVRAVADGAAAFVVRLRTAPNAPPTAALEAPPTATVDAGVTLDARGSTDPDGTVASYRWDVDGDGLVDAVTDAPTLSATYDAVGAVAPTVTVVDDDGATARAGTTVAVVSGTPPDGGDLPPGGVLPPDGFLAESQCTGAVTYGDRSFDFAGGFTDGAVRLDMPLVDAFLFAASNVAAFVANGNVVTDLDVDCAVPREGTPDGAFTFDLGAFAGGDLSVCVRQSDGVTCVDGPVDVDGWHPRDPAAGVGIVFDVVLGDPVEGVVLYPGGAPPAVAG
jgi:hypothetical protein